MYRLCEVTLQPIDGSRYLNEFDRPLEEVFLTKVLILGGYGQIAREPFTAVQNEYSVIPAAHEKIRQ